MCSLTSQFARLRSLGNLLFTAAEVRTTTLKAAGSGLGLNKDVGLARFHSTTFNCSNQFQSSRNYSSSQIFKKTLVTEAAAKPAPPPVVDHHDHEVNLETLGRCREKIDIDGMLINWDKAGSGDHVVLLLPGIIGCIQHDFAPIFQKMDKSKYTLVSWDPPGYGRSRPPDRDFSGVFYRRDGHIVVKLMDKLGYKDFSILGWSNGGITGGYIAADYPSRVRHLVTWGSHAYADERAVMFTKIMGELDMWSPKMLEPAIAMYGREYLLKMMQDWHKAVSDFYNQGLDVTFKEGLGKISCPVLAIHGEEDPVLGVEHAEFLRDNIPNAKLWVMPKGKHNLHLRYTDQFLDVVTKFLDTDEFHLSGSGGGN